MTKTTKPVKAKTAAKAPAKAVAAKPRRRPRGAGYYTQAELEAMAEKSKGTPGYSMIRALTKLAALGPFHFEKMP